MPTVNLTNVPFDPSLREPQGDGGTVENDAAVAVPTVQSVFFPQTVNPAEASAFEGTRQASNGNVLSTPPPALGGGQTNPAAFADAMNRIPVLQTSHPIKNSLTRSSEDGTAPAAPKNYAVTGSTPAAPAPAAEPAKPTTQKASGQTINTAARGNNTDVSQADSELQTEADKIKKDVETSGQKDCNGGSDYAGETRLVNRLGEMGMDKDRAGTLARFLNDTNNNTGGNHNAQDETTIALSIAAYDKLNKAGSTAAANQIVDQLNTVADNFNDSVKTTKASDAYYTAMNTLGGYVMQASSNAAVNSLTSNTATSQVKIVPYPTVVD